ncbi:MAG TPA: hypothetical protein VL485_19895 [Ktedonobacteraceae bacterium]|nr:hypothetical protein [Ktedonobacteraceae bacterium]
MEERTGKKWLWRILDFINPLRDPSLTVAAVLTFIEEVGQHNAWYWIIVIALVNWIAVRGVVWLVVNFAFASTFIARRLWWALQHPRLAWRILDAVGHEEIVIGGGLPAFPEGIMLADGTIMNPMLGASGMHVIGELPAGTEVPILGLPSGQRSGDLASFSPAGFFPGVNNESMNNFADQSTMQFNNSSFVSPQSTDGLPQSFPQRPSEEEERLRQQMAAYIRLMDDWVQFTEEKWRTVSDSQLGWKPLRGRWGSWDDIFQDAYAAKTSDPMAQAAQVAGEATSRRYDSSKDKGSAASAVACFMRDMMTLRRGMEMLQQAAEQNPESFSAPPAMSNVGRNTSKANSGLLRNGNGAGSGLPRNGLIRRPTQIFVDADTNK